ncbi:MAG: molybdate ABC transporter substrate-binding protein [Terracidiphilus sp.]|nr:molybdate ABC transporter substrate-binding protein [Terracidiphilus sp.]
MDTVKRWSKVGRIAAVAVLLGLAVLMANGCRKAQRPVLTLSIAASLEPAIDEVEAVYERQHGAVEFRNNFGSSGTLAREIEQGAPVDAFISAGSKPMDQLESHGLLLAGTRVNLLRNTLVLIVPAGSGLGGMNELTRSDVRLIALGDPASVPAGQYARQALEAMRLYDKVNAKLVLGKDVRQVLTYVETGNADAGFVYATDALSSKSVRVAEAVPEGMHDAIVYPMAVVKGTRNEQAARAFTAFLRLPEATAIFSKYGFRMAAS